MKNPSLFFAIPSLLALVFPFVVHAQSIPNHSFEESASFITGWSVSSTAFVGIGSSTGNTYANNGMVPQGSNVAFIRSGSFRYSTLSTTITGLTPGEKYTVHFRANSRSGFDVPNAGIFLNGDTFKAIAAGPSVGGTNPYHYISADFTATATTASLEIASESQNDTTLLVDDFFITKSEIFTVSPWTGDFSSGIEPGATYWAYHFGSSNTATVNGITVPGINTPDVSVPGRYSLTALSNVFNNDTNALTSAGGSGSALIAKDFRHGSGLLGLTLKSLVPGLKYTVSFLSVGWVDPIAREVFFAKTPDILRVNQDQYGNNNGIRLDHTFTATATTYSMTIQPDNPSYVWHFYGISLKTVSPQALSPLVTNTNDDGTGSLRRALAIATDGSTIPFGSNLDGAAISLTSRITFADEKDFTIDAGNLPAGITINDGTASSYRLFSVPTGYEVTFRNLTFADSGGPGVTGGAIANSGNLTLDRCILSGNSSGIEGGAIDNSGTLSLSRCTLSGNSTGSRGGAISNVGTLSLTDCTLSANSTTGPSSNSFGGAIYNTATLNLTRCTLSGNSSAKGGAIRSYSGSGTATASVNACTISGNSADEGGGIYVNSVASGISLLNLTNSIIAGNSGRFNNGRGRDIFQNSATITPSGVNLIGDLLNSGLTEGPTVIVDPEPKLTPLGDYGSITQTILPLYGSPAVNAAGNTDPGGTDQRGFPRFANGALDIGAVEFNNIQDFATLWPTDLDLDGIPYGIEHALGTDPGKADPGNPDHLTTPVFDATGQATLTFGHNPAADPHTVWRLTRSTTLEPNSFATIFEYPETQEITGPPATRAPIPPRFTVTDIYPSEGKAFYRIEAIFVP